MKKAVSLFLCLCCVLVLPVLAAEEPVLPEETPPPVILDPVEFEDDFYDLPDPSSPVEDADSDRAGGLSDPAAGLTCSGADVTVQWQHNAYTTIAGIEPVSLFADDVDGEAVTPEEASSTMASALKAVFGTYTPRTQTVATYYNGELLNTSTQYVPGLAGLDMEWIAGVVIFTLLLYCLMRLLGGVLS